MRRRSGLWIAGLGLLLLVGAPLVWLTTRSDDRAGDVAGIEASLRAGRSVLPAEEPTTESTTTTQPQPATNPGTVENDDEPPTEVRVPEPIGLRIERIGVAAPVDPYGVDERTREMAVPDNVTDVAWYQFGPRPGERGSAVFAAHVDLASQGRGVFFDLRKLEPGDRVVVEYADGTEAGFTVEARIVYDKTEIPLDVIFAREGPPVLTLITCGGGFNRNVGSYDSNVVVYAVPDADSTPPPGSSV
jgi:hypothetical protein